MSLDIRLYVECNDAGDGEQHTLTLAEFNITHNVAPMWHEAGCYFALYESHGCIAGSFVRDLDNAVKAMLADPDKYRALNAKNGYGTYPEALQWLQEVRNAFKRYPLATISISR